MKKKNILIFGGDSDLGKNINECFIKNFYDTYCFGRKSQNNKNFFKINFLSPSSLKNIIKKNINSTRCTDAIIFSVGEFIKSEDKYSQDKSENFLIIKNIIDVLLSFLLKNKRHTKIIIITSIDGFLGNINSFKYSIDKGKLSMLIKLYNKKFKNKNVSFYEIAPGPINTRMRKKKKENKNQLVQPDDISKLCLMITKMNANIILDTIKILPKKWNFHWY